MLFGSIGMLLDNEMTDTDNNTAIGSFAMSSTNNADAIDNVAIG